MKAGELKIFIVKRWVNGIEEGIGGICSGDRTRMLSKPVSLLHEGFVM